MKAAIQIVRLRIQNMRAQLLERFGHDLVITDRLKVLLAGAAAIFVLSIFIGLDSFTESLENRHTRAQVALERLKVQIENSAWKDRQNQSQILKSVLQDRLWAAPTPGLGEAGFERWLRGRLMAHKMEPQQLQIRRVPVISQVEEGASPNPLKDIQRMTVKIIMPFDQIGLIRFLEDIALGSKTLVVERLIARSGRNARIEMDVSAFYRSQELGDSGEVQ
ncbi:MAG TPA: hypothetical protein DGZ24_07685 [Rhodospirillaceae bacterium]|nr:hypothetical protein [Rhodospirillaceae bacterium]